MVLMGMLWLIQSGSLKAQVINNNGAAISVTGGTFVQGDTLENTSGIITNEGTIGLNGHYINKVLGTTVGNGIYNLRGNWTNTGVFTAGNSSVNFIGSSLQRITSGGETFYDLKVSNNGASIASNRIILLSNVNISNSLSIADGNIETEGNTLYLIHQATGSLLYTSTDSSRIIGKFERGVNAMDNYLFPLGSEDHYNPMNLDFSTIDNAGSILSEFVASDPDSIGLPLADPGYLNDADSVEVYDADSIGYWSVTAKNLFESNNFDVNLDGAGFTVPDQNVTRIIKRKSGEDWTLDGNHKDGIGSVAYRNILIGGIDNSPGHHFGWGHIRPRIQVQPEDTTVCDGDSATFSIVATGRGTLYYEWEVLKGSGGWIPITDIGPYANSDTDTLLIIAADTSMNGYKYRAIVTDSLGNFHRSNAQATLTVYPRPQVTATPQQDTICNVETTHIVLTSTEPLTSYNIEILNQISNNIIGDDGFLDGDTIKDVLNNPTLEADSVVYRITPYGPFTPSCAGDAIIVVVWVEPTVEINALNDTICNTDFTDIDIRSDNITTNGIQYTWTSSATDSDVSGYTNNIIGQDTIANLADQLINIGTDSAIVHYTITPWTLDASGNLKCEGTSINIDIFVEPTVQITAANDTLCDGDNTNIVVTSPNITTNGIRYTWTYIENPNVTGELNSVDTGQIIGSTISHQLINTSFEKQLVQYIITPWTVNASNENECTDNNEVITIDIWIDPTPRVFTSIVKDTICNDNRVSITLTTPNVLTDGIVTFDYVSIADVGLTGNSNNIDRIHNFTITDSLHNISTAPMPTPLVVRYTITPRALSTGCADGPIVTDSITVHPTAFTDMISDSVVCYLESSGRATVLAENGINDFTYNWDDPYNHQTAATDSVLSIGWYNVTVTDNQSCTKEDSVLIEQPYRIIPVIDTVRNVSCNGVGDGYIILDPTGGNGRYSYLWSTEETSDSISGLSGAYYYVTVTDWKGCVQDTIVEVGEPPQQSANVITNHIRCYGENNGSARVDVLGVYTYEWSTGETTEMISNLAQGTYSVTATNAEGCKYSNSIKIEEPDSLVIDSIILTDISCAGDEDGELELLVIGGNNVNFNNDPPTPLPNPYTYNWWTPDGTGLVADINEQSGLSGGIYYVTVNDWRGCETTDSAEINEPPLYSSSLTSNDIICNGDNDGSIDLTVTGGNTESPYTYYWSTTDGSGLINNAEDQEGLSEGSYYVTVYDAKSCELYNSASIIEPDLLETFLTEDHVSCYNYDDGVIVLDISGGTGSYDILWSNGATTDSIYGLSANTYYVTVTDDNNCITDNYVEITEPEKIENTLSSENITCFGNNNGEIIITPEGGTIPYTYSWSHSETFTDSLANNLGPGNYTISVVDNNNCMEISEVDITQPDQLILTVTKEDISCYGLNDGYISLSMFGGTPEYTYNWSNGFTETSAQMLEKGLYNIHISDIHDCDLDTVIEIIEPNKLVITPEIRRPTCPDIQDGSIVLNLSGGRLPYTIYWDNGSHEEDLYNIRSGIFDILINDSSLCEIDTSFIVRSAHDFCIDIPSAFSPNKDNINDKWEIDMSGLYPHAEIEVFDRWGKRIFYSKGYDASQFWDGTLNGKELPMDAYYYIIYLKNGAKRISGTVTIIR